VDRLYGVRLDQFVAERDALGRELRAEGKREEAAWVAGLRKPTMAAWAVNRVVRGERRKAAALLEAGERLRGSQQGLAGGTTGAEELRRAGEEERSAVAELVEAARELEGAEQLSASALERVSDTLHASTLDEKVRRRVEAARVTRESAAVGFGGLTTAAPGARPARKRSKPVRDESRGEKAGEDGRGREQERAAKEELRRVEADLAGEKESLSDARNAVRHVKRERDRLQKELGRADRAVDKAAARVERLTEEAKVARRRVAELRKGGVESR
jgi:hypothetical protein